MVWAGVLCWTEMPVQCVEITHPKKVYGHNEM